MAKNLLNSITNTKTRTLVIFLGFLITVTIFFIFFKRSSDNDPLETKTSRTAAVPSSIRAVPGNETPEKYRELQIEENRQRVLEAYQKKTSAIPTIVGSVSTNELENQRDELLNSTPENDTSNLFGDTERGGFVGKGNLVRRNSSANAIQAREEKIEKEKERVRQLRDDRQKQKELDQARRAAAEEQARYADAIKQTTKSMQNHAAAIFPNWNQFNNQEMIMGVLAKNELATKDNPTTLGSSNSEVNNKEMVVGPDGKMIKRELIKAGSVLFGVIETAINTDEPSPVMATVVSGKYKGGKLLGSISHSSRQEKLVLNFTVLSLPKHSSSIKIKAVAIDPDTARTALASDVDHHYLLRYGTLFASAFMEGYGDAISDQGNTTITAPTGTITSVKSNLSGKEEFYSALGEVGKKWARQTEKIFDRPYTVTVNQGEGVGVLFLEDIDVSDPDNSPSGQNPVATISNNTISN